ncbi:hypothetical protein PCO86_11595 [Pectobacteriaceae bacterium CE70]|nr:hypothetical protein PCO86_11595 [Pectobacteriaceae bacterium CE70]
MYSQIVAQNICFIRADPDRPIFYYCAAAPSIVVTASNQPAVQLQIFRNSSQPSDVYYATLSLRTQLASSPEAAQAAANASPDIPREAILLPLQAIACSATLDVPAMIPGQTSKTALNSQQDCYLLGKLTSVNDIALLAKLMSTPASTPIAVSYKIDYLLQLPPSTFELEASWDQVYHYLKESFGFNFLVFSLDIEKISSKLISKKIVTIKVKETDPDSHIKQAGDELTQILTSEFFTPVFATAPQQPQPKFGFYLQRISIEDIDQRRLSAKLTETTAVKRSLYPQALFAELVEGSDYQVDRVVTKCDLQDDFFADRIITAHLLSSTLDSNVQLVVVSFRYGGETRQQIVFDHDDTQPKIFKVPSITDSQTGKMLWPVEYDFTVYFNQAIGSVTSVQSDRMNTTLTEVYLDVESVYARYDFVIEAASHFNWQWYQSVLVTIYCRHIQLPDSSISRIFQVTKASPKNNYPVMLPNPDLYQFEVIKNYSKADNSPHISAQLSEVTSQDVFLFSSLYHQRVLTLSASMDWQEIDKAVVFASYPYLPTDGNASLQQTFLFTESGVNPQIFSADQIDSALRTINLDIWFTYHIGKGEGKPLNIQTSTVQDSIDIANLD